MAAKPKKVTRKRRSEKLTRAGWIRRMQLETGEPIAGNGQGRPVKVPSKKQRELVEMLAGFGIPQPQIGIVVDMEPDTLRKHFSAELKRGNAAVEANLLGNLFRLAQGTTPTALRAIMFALGTKFGYSAFNPRVKPEPDPDRPEVLGKKAARQEAANTGHQGTDWADLVKH